jgi:hypothetical protein
MARVTTRRRTNVSLLLLVWLVVGVIVAVDRDYVTLDLLKLLLSAVLAIVLWPLLLLGVNLRIS